MPRQSRIDAPGAVHHIIARGIERGKVFRDDQDREFFLKQLGELILETKTKCFAWALIFNQFFLEKGIELGRQPELVGGGLVRSALESH